MGIEQLEHADPASTPNSLDDYEAQSSFRVLNWLALFLVDKTPRLAGSLITLRSQVNELAPTRDKASDGWLGDAKHRRRKSDHNPDIRDGDYGVVSALDITHDPEHGCNAELLAESLRLNKDPRIKYVIWNKRILSSYIEPWAWRPYNGKNPHTRHIHISVLAEKSLYDDQRQWVISVR